MIENLDEIGFTHEEIFGSDQVSQGRLNEYLGGIERVLAAGLDQEFLINSVLALNAKAIVFGTSTVNIYKPEYIQRAMELLKSTREDFHNRYRIYRSSSDVTDIAMILGLDDLAIEVAFEILNVRNKIEIPWKSAIETPERPLAFEL